MKKVLLSVLAITTLACTKEDVKKPGCAIQDTIVSSLTDTAVEALQCANKDVIKADITKALGSANLCESTTQGPVGTILCPLAVKAVTDLFQSKIPDTWGCKISDGSKLAQFMTDACIKVVPLSK